MQFKPIKDDSLVEQVAKNNSWNNGDRHKIHEIFLIIFSLYLQFEKQYTVRQWLILKLIWWKKTLQLTVTR